MQIALAYYFCSNGNNSWIVNWFDKCQDEHKSPFLKEEEKIYLAALRAMSRSEMDDIQRSDAGLTCTNSVISGTDSIGPNWDNGKPCLVQILIYLYCPAIFRNDIELYKSLFIIKINPFNSLKTVFYIIKYLSSIFIQKPTLRIGTDHVKSVYRDYEPIPALCVIYPIKSCLSSTSISQYFWF